MLNLNIDDKVQRARINALLRTWVAAGALIEVDRRDDGRRETKKFVEVGEWALANGAQPAKGWAGQGCAGGAPSVPSPTCPPLGAGVEQGGAEALTKVGQKGGWAAPPRVVFPASNPALTRSRGPIVAPGETGDEPVPGWEGPR